MKISKIQTQIVRLPADEPLAGGPVTPGAMREMVTLRIGTDAGIEGIGYTFFGAALTGALKQAVDALGNLAIGEDPLRTEAIHAKLRAASAGCGPGGILTLAISAIDIALWDIRGRAAGLPVYRLLGGEAKPIFSYATGGYYREDATHEDYARELAGFVAKGFRAVKLKTGGGTVAEEARRVRTVREAIGTSVSLMLDMNAPYDLDDCIAFARAVEPLDIFWLEEPLHWYLQPADFLRLAQATPIPLAHGERELTRFTVRDFIASGAIRYVQFDATRYAGFTEALRVAALAEQHGVMIAPHTAPELHAHLVAAFPRCGFGVESHGDAARDPVSFGLYREHVQVRDSHVHLGDKPGFGVEIDWEFVKRHRA